jgi:hypothetical protein
MTQIIRKIFQCFGLKKKCHQSTQNVQNVQNKTIPRWKRLFQRKKKNQNSSKTSKNQKALKIKKNIQIPTDCLLEVFKYFKNDLKTLYSCLLVNKHWCISTVRLIWKNPFLNKSSPNVIDVYLSCLTTHEKNNLIINGVDLSNNKKTATFYYANFLRRLNMMKLYTAVEAWTKENK